MENATIEILKGIQGSIAQLRSETLARFDKLETRMDRFEAQIERLDTSMRKDRRNAAGMLVMMRATAGDFDARVSEVEERVAVLENRAS
ncbi:hypothetical protein MKL09_29985 [Methylobacterium sp. J-048]|uniref:hypothetical protein n=1 Tax=Methylobacterium sp. J-048 TaxID=2836635 RepID=UPI001FBB4DA0|nr:hypothetical protein [Methylobacterium sp. J-048]MCJ2060738.1 hypothetical protein [Methylobacterium sp. J-048]